MEWGIIAAAPGWIVTLWVALERVGKLPFQLKRWDRDRIESEHAQIVREEQLTKLAQMAEDLSILVANQALIMKTVLPNGGGSLSDKMTRVEKEVKGLRADVDELLRAKSYTMQEAAEFAGKIAQHGERLGRLERLEGLVDR